MSKRILVGLVACLFPAIASCGGPQELQGEVHSIQKLGKACWYLVADDHRNYELLTQDGNLLQEGHRFIIKGNIDAKKKTICEIGPVVDVISYVPRQ